jgi:hypothetical protein
VDWLESAVWSRGRPASGSLPKLRGTKFSLGPRARVVDTVHEEKDEYQGVIFEALHLIT